MASLRVQVAHGLGLDEISHINALIMNILYARLVAG